MLNQKNQKPKTFFFSLFSKSVNENHQQNNNPTPLLKKVTLKAAELMIFRHYFHPLSVIVLMMMLCLWNILRCYDAYHFHYYHLSPPNSYNCFHGLCLSLCRINIIFAWSMSIKFWENSVLMFNGK